MQKCDTSPLPLARGLSIILNLYRGVLNMLLIELRTLDADKAASLMR